MRPYIPIVLTFGLLMTGCAAFVAAPGVEGIMAQNEGQQSVVERGVRWVCGYLDGEMQPNGDCEADLLGGLF